MGVIRKTSLTISVMTIRPHGPPDGKRIAFTSYRDKDGLNSEIYVMDADGGNQQRLTKNRKNDWFPSWSPDGGNALPSRLIGRGTLQTLKSTR